MKPNLEVKIGRLKLKNPVMNASGTFGFGRGFAKIENPSKLGAIISKTITLKPKKGNPLPWIVKVEGGFLNSIGLANEGIEKFVKETLPQYLKFGPPIIPSIAGDTIEDYGQLARILDKTQGVSGIEINTSCPNIHGGNLPFGSDPKVVEPLVNEVRRRTKLPLIVKLTPNVGKIEPLAKAAEKAGADALSLINTLLGLTIDVETRKPRLGGVTGGISGPAIKPHGVLRVFQVSRAVKIPLIGIGGISNFKDALEYIIAGATAVGIGTANYFNPKATVEILEGINNYLLENEIKNIYELRGTLKADDGS